MAVTRYTPSMEGKHPRVTVACAVTNVATTTAEIEVKAFKRGSMFIPSGSTINTITWYAVAAAGDTAFPITSAGNAAVAQVVAANNAYEINSSVFSFGYVLPVATAGSNTISFYFESDG